MVQADWRVPAFREGSALLARSISPHLLLWYFVGMEEVRTSPISEPSLPPATHVGSEALHATGLGGTVDRRHRGGDARALRRRGDVRWR